VLSDALLNPLQSNEMSPLEATGQNGIFIDTNGMKDVFTKKKKQNKKTETCAYLLDLDSAAWKRGETKKRRKAYFPES